ncbi:MAG TPA: sigma-70 family RNA polymerase sigma factor [Verrucomicrobiae bacterium]
MTSDLDLLRQFAGENSQDAFTEIVRRHVNLVYSAALRQVRSPQLAEEIAQSVFADLARSGTGILPVNETNSLTPWLYAITRRTAIDVIRKEWRRQLREQIAVEMNDMNATANSGTGVPPVWTDIEVHLDDAMTALDETDRSAILLRYFENKNLREVGESLKISDDAAQKRVSRAVERLREFFLKQKITIGASGLAILISANAVQSAPIGLAATISAAAVLTGTAVHTSTIIAATKTIAMTTIQKTFVTAALVTTVGAGIFEAHQASQLREQTKSLAQQIVQLQTDNESLSNRIAAIGDAKKLSDEQFNELLKLRGQVTQLRNEAEVENDPAFQKARLWLAKENKLRQQFADHPDQWIPEMKYLSDEEWLDQARKADLDTATGMRCALSNVRVAAAFDFGSKITEALHTYMNANNQQPPDSTSQLSAYFHPPIDDADTILSRYEMLNSDEQANPTYSGALIIQSQNALVDHIDNAILIGEQTVSSVPPPHWPAVLPDELEPVMKAYADANQHGFLSIYDLEPYATTPAEKEALNKVIKTATTFVGVAAP